MLVFVNVISTLGVDFACVFGCPRNDRIRVLGLFPVAFGCLSSSFLSILWWVYLN